MNALGDSGEDLPDGRLYVYLSGNNFNKIK